MTYWYQSATPLLATCVKTVLIIDGAVPSQPAKVPLFTGGMPALVWRIEKDDTGVERTKNLLAFAKSPPTESLIADENTSVIIFFFLPFALPCIFNIAAADLIREPQELNTVPNLPDNNPEIKAKVTALDNLVINYFEQNKRNFDIIKYVTDRLMNSNGPETLLDIQQELSLTERSFQRIFKKYVGVTPNQYRRICQFEASFTQLRANGFDKLAEVAYQNGFADQSHFIRSFKEFTDTNPRAYLKSGLSGKKKKFNVGFVLFCRYRFNLCLPINNIKNGRKNFTLPLV